MKNKSLLSGVLIGALVISSVAYTSANFSGVSFMKGFGFNSEISSIDKEVLEGMTSEEKAAYMEEKREEFKLTIEKREAVIDKLLNKESLTSEEDAIRLEIIAERAERKANMEKMHLKMQEKRDLVEKLKSGAELTSEEQELIDSFKGFNGDKKSMGKMHFSKGMNR